MSEPWRHIDLEIDTPYDPVFVRVGPAGVVVEVMLDEDNDVELNIYDATDAAADRLDRFEVARYHKEE